MLTILSIYRFGRLIQILKTLHNQNAMVASMMSHRSTKSHFSITDSGSISDLDPHLMAPWIRIRIPNADPGGLKRKEKRILKAGLIRIKSNVIGIKWANATVLIFIKN
jgi:hypothetical protein